MAHEKDIEKAFQEWFLGWVDAETKRQVDEKVRAPIVSKVTIRHDVRDHALNGIRHVIERAQGDRLEMVRFENPLQERSGS